MTENERTQVRVLAGEIAAAARGEGVRSGVAGLVELPLAGLAGDARLGAALSEAAGYLSLASEGRTVHRLQLAARRMRGALRCVGTDSEAWHALRGLSWRLDALLVDELFGAWSTMDELGRIAGGIVRESEEGEHLDTGEALELIHRVAEVTR